MSKKVHCLGDWCWSNCIILKNTSGSKKSDSQVLKEMGWERHGFLGHYWVCPRCAEIYREKEAELTIEY